MSVILPAAGPVIKVQFQHILGSDADAATHLYVGYDGSAPADTDLNSWANTWASAWIAHMESVAGTDCELTNVVCTDLSVISGSRGSTTAAATGTRSGGPLPGNAALLQNFQIKRRYRGGKPRAYWPYGVDTDLSSAQSWTSSFLSAFVTAYNAFQAEAFASPPGSTSGLGLVSVGYYSGYTLGPPAAGGYRKKIPTPLGSPHVDPVYNYTLNAIPGSQRRRLRKR